MYDDVETTGWDRAGIAAVILLLAAFVLGAITPLASTAGAEDSVAATRDDDSRELVGVEDDDDDDDGDSGATGPNGGTGSVGSNGASGSASIGSNSANTKTGTTRGTGVSRSVSNSSDASKNTKTGTTRGTGKSKSVSNSS